MALEAVVFQQDLFSHTTKELYNLLGGNWGGCDHLIQENDDHNKFVPSSFDHFIENQRENLFDGGENNWYSSSSPPTSMVPHFNELHLNHSSPDGSNANNGTHELQQQQQQVDLTSNIVPTDARAKRRRSRTKKNKEEIENQRMTHIAVERNRRKQMNEYLAVLRSLMPESYVQRGDQASIIGGAINFVKELEQRLQLLAAHTETQENTEAEVSATPFSEFFTFPQYTTGASSTGCDNSVAVTEAMSSSSSSTTQTQFALADIEVTMVESHANLKIRSKRRPKLLLKVVSGLQSMRLSILHLNVTTVDQTVLYSLSVKVEDDCNLNSVDEIATAVYQLLGRIQEESV